MSGLIQRLRDMAEFRHMDRSQDAIDDIMREAADEIERLRSEHDAWRDAAIEQQLKLKRSEAERQRQAEVMEEVRKVLGDVLQYNRAFPHLPGEISETLRRLLSQLEEQ